MLPSWASFFRAFAEQLLTYESRQASLVAALREAGVGKLEEKDAQGRVVLLQVMDPFTAFSAILKYGNAARRVKIFNHLGRAWGLDLLLNTNETFAGLAAPLPFDFWFFSPQNKRLPTDIPTLWQVFKEGLAERVTEATWQAALDIRNINWAKLTQGLSWIAPQTYFPLTGLTASFLQGSPPPTTWQAYQALLLAMQKQHPEGFSALLAGLGATHLSTVAEPASAYEAHNSVPAVAHPLNTILFGPPGTGKTYHTITHAIAILEGQTIAAVQNRARQEVKAAFDAYVAQGQVAFVTFHPSFSYEDFVEGIKPRLNRSEDADAETQTNGGAVTDLQYEIADGVFKQICERAAAYQAYANSPDFTFPTSFGAVLAKARFAKLSLGNVLNPEDQAVYEYCIAQNRIGLGWGADYNCTPYENETALVESLKAQGETHRPTLNMLKAFRFWLQKDDIVLISDGLTRIRAIGRVTGPYFYDAKASIPYRHFRTVEWLAKEVKIPVHEVYAKQFSQQTFYPLYDGLIRKPFFQERVARKPKPHVLILDEVNRGQVAHIFGELITLLEPDKRLGQPEAVTLTLPYSKRNFGVPDNLYILGTMNTADRSVAALDTALRRRFVFQAQLPQAALLPETLTDAPVNLRRLLETLNARLERLLDQDHTIGHAYFLPIQTFEELQTVFARQILPLLQEYFFRDPARIGMVLGRSFVQPQTEPRTFAPGFRDFLEAFEDQPRYTLLDSYTRTPEDFISIYA